MQRSLMLTVLLAALMLLSAFPAAAVSSAIVTTSSSAPTTAARRLPGSKWAPMATTPSAEADTAVGRHPATEREALSCFATATGGAHSWFRSDGWLTEAPICKWYGVSCGPAGTVVNLTLGDNNLTGR